MNIHDWIINFVNEVEQNKKILYRFNFVNPNFVDFLTYLIFENG